ncbi:MAG: hypothetical protein ACYSR1_01430 [Planctomycetota bacterium]|jgi:hypothetical protein
MTDYPSQEPQRIYYECFKEHLTQWEWSWFVTLTFPEDTSYESARRQFDHWRLQLIDEERLQLGIFLVTSHKADVLHFHCLLIGRSRHGKTLMDCSTQRWEAAWRHRAEIKEVESNEGACDYTAQHFLGFKSDHAEYDFYGRTLLQQEKIPHIEGDFGVDIL